MKNYDVSCPSGTHELLKLDLSVFMVCTRLLAGRGIDVYQSCFDGEHRLLLRDCAVCGSTISFKVPIDRFDLSDPDELTPLVPEEPELDDELLFEGPPTVKDPLRELPFEELIEADKRERASAPTRREIKAVRTDAPECSICRGRHGREIEHACE